MKFRVERDRLAEAVAWASRTLSPRPKAPVLSGLLVTVDDQGLVLSTYDQEASSRVEVDADIETEGRALVSGRLLADIARSLPAQPVSVVLEGSRLLLTCGRASFRLPTLPVEDYPALPSMPEQAGTIDGATFAAAVQQVAIAAAREDTVPVLTGVRLEVDGDRLTLASTDRFRLAVREVSWMPESPDLQTAALIPARTLADTAKTLAGSPLVSVALSAALADGGLGQGIVGFEGNGRHTTTRVLDGAFPQYRNLLPSAVSTVAFVETTGFVDALKRVRLVTERHSPVRLSFDGDEVVLRAGSGDEAQAVEAVECRLEGDPIEIAFNPDFLFDGVNALTDPSVRFAFTLPSKPAVLSGQPADAADDSAVVPDYRYLIMPIRLAG